MTVTSKEQAWNEVNKIFPTDYEQDLSSTSRAGYPIYRSTADGHYYDYICDLGNRLEVNLSNGKTINVWIEEPAAEATEEPKEQESEATMEQRQDVAKRLQRLTYYYTVEYVKELENKAKEDAAVKAMQANPSGELKMMVCTAENNAKVMMDCMKDTIRAVEILTDAAQDVNVWMLAGITAMIDKVNELRGIPFDLPTSICGLLCAQYR